MFLLKDKKKKGNGKVYFVLQVLECLQNIQQDQTFIIDKFREGNKAVIFSI